MGHRTLSRILLWAAVFVALVAVMAPRMIHGQQPASGWSRPEVIAETSGRLADGAMALVADGFGHLHLFYPHTVDDEDPGAIEYLFWDGTEWSGPIDILVDPHGAYPAGIRAALDENRTVHLLWGGQGGWLMHSSAPLAEAGSPHAWSEPMRAASGFADADLIEGPGGTLYVAYAGYPVTGYVAMISSSDGGRTWTQPVDVAAAGEPGTTPNEVRLAMDGAGRLHAVWTEYELPNGWPPTGAFYSRSTDGGMTWDYPRRVAEAGHGQIGVGTVGEDGLHLVWRSTIGGDGTFHLNSADGGETWSMPPLRYDDRGGFSGLPSLAGDSVGRVHFVTGASTYGTWEQGQAATYEDLRTEAAMAQARESYGERGTMAITTGNRLHAVFETDFNRLWYTTKELDAPAAPTVTPAAEREAPVATDTPVLTATASPTEAGPTPAAVAVLPPEPEAGESQEVTGVLAGVLAAAGLVSVVVAASLLRIGRG